MLHDMMTVMPAPLVLALVGLAVVTESALLLGLLLPGSTLLLTLGLTTKLGEVSLSAAIPVAVTAAVVGGQLAYLRGRRPVRRGPPGRLNRSVARAEAMVARHGVWSIVIAQWVAGLRTFAPRLAGRARVPYRVFALAQVAVSAVWAVAFVSLGHFTGLALQQRIGTVVALAGAAVLVLGFAGYALRHRIRRTTAAQADAQAVAAASTERTAAKPRTARIEPFPGTWPVGPWMCSPW